MWLRAFARVFGLIVGFLVFATACIALSCAVLLRVRYLWLFAVIVAGWLSLVVEEGGLVIVGVCGGGGGVRDCRCRSVRCVWRC